VFAILPQQGNVTGNTSYLYLASTTANDRGGIAFLLTFITQTPSRLLFACMAKYTRLQIDCAC